ncbi:MAG: peptidoglycan DD-metalloendopeptidase family protein [Selenomonadaceae bacterium]|nr:peptidoglycan DD-metalloendopeptidase family protein [Selenomonadaceae bacterium]
MKKIFFAFLFFILTAGTIVSADELEDEKSEYEAAAEEARQKAEAIQMKIDSVSELKKVLDEEAFTAVADYDAKQNALDETVERLEENSLKLLETQRDLEKKHKVLEKRVRDIYINGQISYIDVLFGAKDFSDFLTRMDLLKRVIMQDSSLVSEVLDYQKEIIEIAKKLEADKKIQEELTAKAELAKNIKLEKVAKQQALIDRMNNDKEVYDRQYAEMMAASAEVAKLIEQKRYREQVAAIQSQYTGNISGSGTMIWPVSGEITSPFGWRTHPIFGSQIFHSGMDIGADYGVPIVAAQSGVVIESGWIGGYGNTIMIDHGGGVVTLYGHNQSLAVDVGQTVSQGQVIAYCGSTGNSTGPHCHFEVRLNGEPVSPYNYL